jgi:hypothetical protein
MRTAALSALIALALVAPGAAADKNTEVHFAKGKSSATLTGTLKGYDTVNYLLGASAGQTLTVTFAPKNGACYFNVVAPGADSAMFMSDVSGNTFSGALPANGTYKVQAYLMRSAARRGESCKHTISFSITGNAASAPAASATPSKDEQACLQAVSIQTNNGDVVVLSYEQSEANNEVIVGVGEQRARWRCLVKDGQVDEVMSLTDEGRL